MSHLILARVSDLGLKNKNNMPFSVCGCSGGLQSQNVIKRKDRKNT